MNDEYYRVLGLTRKAAPEDIKKAHRRCAMEHHPDRGGDTAKFAVIQHAYTVLINPTLRAAYDRVSRPFSAEEDIPRPKSRLYMDSPNLDSF